MSAGWTTQEAVDLCIKLEAIAPNFGAHIGLTGGLLYKQGERKDADIIIYRIRQVQAIDSDGLFAAFAEIGVEKVSGFGWCHKATYQGKPIDFFFPEEDGEYDSAHVALLLSDDELMDLLAKPKVTAGYDLGDMRGVS